MGKFLRRAGLLFFVLLLLVVGAGSMFLWSAKRKFNAKVQQLRQDGQPVSIADLGEFGAGEEEGTRLLADLESPLMTLDQAMTQQDSSQRDLRVALFRAFETQHPELISKLRDAAGEPGIGKPLDYSLDSRSFQMALHRRISLFSLATRALHYHAESELDGGRTDEAMLDAVAMMKWSDKLSYQPCGVSYLKSMAIRDSALHVAAECLYRGDGSKAVRDELLSAIEGYDRVSAWNRMIASERALSITMQDELPGMVRVSMAVAGGSPEVLDVYRQYEAYGKQANGLDCGIKPSKPMADVVAQSLHISLASSRRVQALSAAVLILAKWQDAGSDPSIGIKDLGLADFITTDPINSSVMKFKVAPQGPTIYSVGVNGVDDGGSLDDEADIGIAPPSAD